MRFRAKLVDADARVSDREIEAADAATARLALAQSGSDVMELAPVSPFARLTLRSSSATLDPDRFAAQLLALLRAGLTVVEATTVLAEKEQDPHARSSIQALLGSLHRGQGFSQALREVLQARVPILMATVRASEQTGDLSKGLARYLEYAQAFSRVRQQLRSVLIYPTVLISVGVLVGMFLILYVVPRFARVYADLSTELPLFSRWLYRTGQFIDNHAALVAAVLVVGATGIALVIASKAARGALFRQFTRLPGVGERIHTYRLAQLFRTRRSLPTTPWTRQATPTATQKLRRASTRTTRQRGRWGVCSAPLSQWSPRERRRRLG